MRDDPEIPASLIADGLRNNHGIEAQSITFIPVGFDMASAAYKVIGSAGQSLFVKTTIGIADAETLWLPAALVHAGVPNVLAPIPSISGHSSVRIGTSDISMCVFPFIDGDNAVAVGMSEYQWRQFGSTMRAVHNSELAGKFGGRLRTETFTLPSADLVGQIPAMIEESSVQSAAVCDFINLWRINQQLIETALKRATRLGESLQSREFEHVICHADVHAANILVEGDSQIWIIDWGTAMIAPRERDLLFVIGSRIAREVTTEEEAWFFDGYGSVSVDRDALFYYRYERVMEDLGEFAKSILANHPMSEETRTEQFELALGFFAVDGDLAKAERSGSVASLYGTAGIAGPFHE